MFCASKQREKGRELKLEKERDNVSNNWIYMRVHVPRFRCSAHLNKEKKEKKRVKVRERNWNNWKKRKRGELELEISKDNSKTIQRRLVRKERLDQTL